MPRRTSLPWPRQGSTSPTWQAGSSKRAGRRAASTESPAVGARTGGTCAGSAFEKRGDGTRLTLTRWNSAAAHDRGSAGRSQLRLAAPLLLLPDRLSGIAERAERPLTPFYRHCAPRAFRSSVNRGHVSRCHPGVEPADRFRLPRQLFLAQKWLLPSERDPELSDIG